MGKVLTLLYHRVRQYEKDIQLLAVTPEHFMEQMNWLKENYRIVKFDEDWDLIDEDAVCITFDDGYRDNFLTAVPILNDLQIPATIFVATGNIDSNREMWWDELERNLLLDKTYQKSFYLRDDLFECIWDTSSRKRREDLYYTLHWLMKQVGVNKRNDWIKQLQNWNTFNEDGRNENKCFQIEDLECIDISYILIGGHTVNHPCLSNISAEEQLKEIMISKQQLEKVFGREVCTFSYPFGGRTDYSEETIKICKKLKFSKVAANIPGIWESGDDPYQIPRHIVRDWGLEQFKKSVRTFWEGK